MSLYDGLGVDNTQGKATGWSPSFQMLKTQLQARKATLTKAKNEKGRLSSSVAPVVDFTKLRQDDTSLEDMRDAKPSVFLGGEILEKFADEYDPLHPNDYDHMTKKDRERKENQQDAGRDRELEERRKRRAERHAKKGPDDELPRPMGFGDEVDFEREKKKRVMGNKVAIAPPTVLIEADKQSLPTGMAPTSDRSMSPPLPSAVGTQFARNLAHMTSSSRHYYVIMKLLYVITSFLFATCVAETWHELNGVEYFIYRGQKQNFSSAESFCEEKNASLVLIKSKQIQDFLAEKIGNSTDRPHSFYIGLLRINGTKHGFQWIDGTPLTFTQWRNREPNNKLQMEDCVQMGRRGRLDATYSWNDMPCHSNTKVICQRPTKEKVTTSSVIVTSATTVTTQVSLDEKLIKSSTVKDGTVLPNTSDTETLTNFPTTSNPTTLYGTLVKMSTVENTPPQTDHTSSFYTVEFNPTSSEPLPTSTIDGKIETVKLTTQQMLRSSTKTQTIPASTTVGTTRKLIENQHTDETSDPSTQKNPATTPYISLHHEKHTTTPQQSESTTTEASTHITEPATTASVSLDKTRDKQTESPTTFRTTIPASTTVVPDTTQVTTSFYTLSMRATKSHTTPTIGILDTQDDTTLSPTTTTTQTTTTAPHISSGVVGHDISTQTQQAKTTNENIVTTHSATTKQTIVPRPTEIISTSRKVTRRINQEPSTIESLLNTTSAIQQAAQTNKTQATTHMNEDLPNAGARVMVTAIEANNLNIAGAGGSPEQCDCPPYYIIGIVIAILAIIAALVILGIWKRKERKRTQRIDEEREENPRHLYNEQY